MAIHDKIKEFLDKENVSYQILEHPLAYTASEIAGSQHIPGKQMVKSVIVKCDGEFVMCVLPSIHMIDFEKLATISGSKDVQLAGETEIAELFPDYEVGAEPPFGHELKVFADQLLEEDEEIVCNAGTHTEVVRLKFDDFKRIVNLTIAKIGTHI